MDCVGPICPATADLNQNGSRLLKSLPLMRATWAVVVMALAFSCLPALAEVTATILPSEPPAERSVELQEVWRIGGEDDEDILIGVVGRGVMDDQGNTYLLDRQLSQILVIGPDGELAKTLGREGEGPGEMSRPSDVFLTCGVGPEWH